MRDSFGYFFYFYYYALRGIFRKQDLCLPTEAFYCKSKFLLTNALYLKWKQLFQAESCRTEIPFTYYWPEFEKFYLKTMDKLQFNYRNILHLGHEIIFYRDPPEIQMSSATINAPPTGH